MGLFSSFWSGISSANSSIGTTITKSSSLSSKEKSSESCPVSLKDPKQDHPVSISRGPSILSPDFDEKRAQAEAKFNAFQKGMQLMKDEKK